MRVEDDLQMERDQSMKTFRVVLCLCPPEQTQKVEPQATLKVSGLNTVTVQTGRNHRAHVLEFDAVWGEEASLKDIYKSTAQPLVEYLMNGYNGCVIAYGPPNCLDPHSGQSSCGRLKDIISRAADHIFNSPESSHCKVQASFYHISNEKVYDLLDPQVSEVCRIHDTEEAVLLEGLKEVEVSSTQELLQVYRRGTVRRNAGVSKGHFASKSHMVFNIMITNTRGQSDNEGLQTVSKLTLVDLASSAKAAYRSSAAQDMRRSFHVVPENLQEAKTLKRSLTIFRNVIFSLSAAGCQHVPYRESKLTRTLRDCLGGNFRTCLLVTVATQASSITETMSCLQFAAQAMSVPSRPIHTSQIYHTSSQVQNMWPPERSTLLLTRTQMLPPVSTDRRSQTCLPPILVTSGSLPKPKLKPRCSLEGSESHSFLLHLEKTLPTEMNGHHGRGSQNMGQRSRPVDVCVLKCPVPLSHCLSTNILSSSSSSLGSLVTAGTTPECPNCRQERKIREEYDKFIVQVKRDRDCLIQRVTELEEALKSQGQDEREERKSVKEGAEIWREEKEIRREGRKSMMDEKEKRECVKEEKEGRKRVKDKRVSIGQVQENARISKESMGEEKESWKEENESSKKERETANEWSKSFREGERVREEKERERGSVKESRHGEREGKESVSEGIEKREKVGKIKETTREESESISEQREFEKEVIDSERKEREEAAAEDWNGGGRVMGNDSGRKESSTPHEEKSSEEEVECMTAYLKVCIQQEKALAHTLQCEKDQFTQNVQNLQAELERERNMSGQRISSLHSHTEHLLLELNRVKEECEGLRKRAALSITQLQKEKDELISHIENTKSHYENVSLENAELKARLEALLKENSRPCSECHCNMGQHTSHTHTGRHTHMDTHSTSHTHAVTKNTEMLLMSHCVSKQCTTDLPQGSKCCYSMCSGFPESSDGGYADRSTEPISHACYCDPSLQKPHLYKQLRREHSLLLDVMLVLYKREWFLQDAMPYVRRTLRKCGLSLDHTH